MEIGVVMGKADKQDRLFNLHQNLVHSLAWRIHRRSFQKVAIEDLIAYGQLGLIQAIRSFDASHGTKFTTYAWYRVRGAIFDGLATMSWFDRGSFERGEYEQPDEERRSGKSTEANIGTASDSRSSLAGRRVPNIDGNYQDNLPGNSPSGDAVALHHELLAFLRDLITALPEKEAGLVRGVFFEGRTLTEAARRVGISTAWASRLQTRTLADLRVSLESAGFGRPD